MIASYGIITGVDNSVTTVIAWRHLLTVFRLVGPAARTRSQRRARSESRAVHWDRPQLALQPQDLDIDAAIENILVNSGGLQQVFPRQQPLRRFEKGQQQRILAFAQRDRRRIGIEQSSATPFELPALESISASFRITRSCNPFHFLPPQYGTEAGEQFPEAEWFYNIVVRPEFEADDAIDFVETMAGRDDNRNIRVGTNFPTDKFGRSTARQSRNGTVDQRSSAIDAGPAGIAPRCGRRQLILIPV